MPFLLNEEKAIDAVLDKPSLFATQKFMITFEWGVEDVGDGISFFRSSVEKDCPISWPAKDDVSIQGHDLIGWYLKSDPSKKLVANADGNPIAGSSAATATETVTYKALYSSLENRKHDVTVRIDLPNDAKQPDGQPFPSNGTLPNGEPTTTIISVENGSQITVDDLPPIPEVLGYNNDGWYLVNGAGSEEKLAGTRVTVNNNLALEARYTFVGTVNVGFTWGKATTDDTSTSAGMQHDLVCTITKGHSLLSGAVPNPIIDDGSIWEFEGWDDGAGGALQNSETITTALFDNNVTYEAKYKKLDTGSPVDPDPDKPPVDPDTPGDGSDTGKDGNDDSHGDVSGGGSDEGGNEGGSSGGGDSGDSGDDGGSGGPGENAGAGGSSTGAGSQGNGSNAPFGPEGPAPTLPFDPSHPMSPNAPVGYTLPGFREGLTKEGSGEGEGMDSLLSGAAGPDGDTGAEKGGVASEIDKAVEAFLNANATSESAFDAESGESTGIWPVVAKVAVPLSLAGGTALAAFIMTRVADFSAANAKAARNLKPRRKSGRGSKSKPTKAGA